MAQTFFEMTKWKNLSWEDVILKEEQIVNAKYKRTMIELDCEETLEYLYFIYIHRMELHCGHSSIQLFSHLSCHLSMSKKIQNVTE